VDLSDTVVTDEHESALSESSPVPFNDAEG
jgi:hypothetical protein